MVFVNIKLALTASTNWQWAAVLWPLVAIALMLLAMIVFWPQVNDRVVWLRRAVAGMFRGRGADDDTSHA